MALGVSIIIIRLGHAQLVLQQYNIFQAHIYNLYQAYIIMHVSPFRLSEKNRPGNAKRRMECAWELETPFYELPTTACMCTSIQSCSKWRAMD